jgi:RimJ/RimL family protein N-acetyltransferase
MRMFDIHSQRSSSTRPRPGSEYAENANLHQKVDDGTKGGKAKAIVPIRSLGENHRGRIAQHLLSLDAQDRYLRFGYTAQDAQIQKYADQLDFERDEVFGIYNRSLKLIAVAHLAVPDQRDFSNCAEFGVSVVSSARGRGYGGRLFERAALSASNAGIQLMFIHALSENVAMLKIARSAGALVERDGSESEAYLQLPGATFDTHITEMIEEQVAQFDYRFKAQAKQFRGFLKSLQSDRESD